MLFSIVGSVYSNNNKQYGLYLLCVLEKLLLPLCLYHSFGALTWGIEARTLNGKLDVQAQYMSHRICNSIVLLVISASKIYRRSKISNLTIRVKRNSQVTITIGYMDYIIVYYNLEAPKK